MKTKNESNGTVETVTATQTQTGAGPANADRVARRVWTLEVERERIVPSGTNPRKEFPEEMLRQRGESLRKQGQLVALIVRPAGLKIEDCKLGIEDLEGLIREPKTRFEIADGECRWRAAAKKYADLARLKCDVRLLSDEEVVEIQWSSWLQRENLSPLDEAMGLAGLRAQGWSVERLCERFGLAKSSVFGALKLARLEGTARKLVAEGKISPSVAALIGSVPDKAVQEELVKGRGWGAAVFDREGNVKPVREVARFIEEKCVRAIPWELDVVFGEQKKETKGDLQKGAKDAKGDGPRGGPGQTGPGPAHAKLVSGTCRECPKMTRNMVEENPELAKGPARCMGLSCFAERAKAVTGLRRAVAKVKGLEFFDAEQFQERAYEREYCVEGRQNYELGAGKKWEQVAGKVPHFALAEDGNGGVVRIWRRGDLVKAGVLKEEKGSRSSGENTHRREQLLLKRVKELVLKQLAAAITEASPSGANLKAVEAGTTAKLVRAYAYAEMEPYDSKRKVGELSVWEALKMMAERLCGNRWYRLDDAPAGLGLFGIEVKKVAAQAKAELAAKKKTKGKKNGSAQKVDKSAKGTKKTK